MELIEKPWGKEEVVEINNFYMVKRLTMYAGKRCSLQYHKEKIETIYVLSGQLKVYVGENKDNLEFSILKANEFLTLKNFTVHRMEAITDSIYLESSTPQMEDVVRISDDYDRI